MCQAHALRVITYPKTTRHTSLWTVNKSKVTGDAFGDVELGEISSGSAATVCAESRRGVPRLCEAEPNAETSSQSRGVSRERTVYAPVNAASPACARETNNNSRKQHHTTNYDNNAILLLCSNSKDRRQRLQHGWLYQFSLYIISYCFLQCLANKKSDCNFCV